MGVRFHFHIRRALHTETSTFWRVTDRKLHNTFSVMLVGFTVSPNAAGSSSATLQIVNYFAGCNKEERALDTDFRRLAATSFVEWNKLKKYSFIIFTNFLPICFFIFVYFLRIHGLCKSLEFFTSLHFLRDTSFYPFFSFLIFLSLCMNLFICLCVCIFI